MKIVSGIFPTAKLAAAKEMKPRPAVIPFVNKWMLPIDSAVPPRAQSTPQRIREIYCHRTGLIPTVIAATGCSPVALSCKPNFDRCTNKYTITARIQDPYVITF